MSQSVLEGVVAIEAKAAKVVEEAKARAKQIHDQVSADLEGLAQDLEQQAEEEIAEHTRTVEANKAAALAELDEQLAASLRAVEALKAQQVAAGAAEVARLLEPRADGD